MNQSPDNKNRRIPRLLLVWLAAFLLITVAIVIVTLAQHFEPPQNLFWGRILFTSFAVTSVPVLLWVVTRWACTRRNWGRALVSLAGIATLIAIFYLEEDWRGRHAWQSSKRELEAKGVVLDWDKYIPPPVPDDQNFFKAPNMQEWFVRGVVKTNGTSFLYNPTNALRGLSTNGLTTATISNVTVAAAYLEWSDQFQPQFDQIREALKRPFARMDGDYSVPYESPTPNFIQVRILAQALAQRARCHILLGQPNKALDDLTFLNDSRRLLEGAPTGKPMTLVAAMINVAVTGLYADAVAKSFQTHAWSESELTALQKQLESINVLPAVAQSFESEPAATTRTLEIIPWSKLKGSFYSGDESSIWRRIQLLAWALMPRGWIYQNMVFVAQIGHEWNQGYDLTNNVVLPRKFDDMLREVNGAVLRDSDNPYKFLAATAVPNFTRAWQTTAHNQAMVIEAQIACALERYRLANGAYPETLDALTPQFIEKLPHDLINGGPLIYHRTDDGKFLLYSVGWNETDDGGQVPAPLGRAGAIDYTLGDWVWKN